MPDKAELYNVHMGWIESCERSAKLTEWEENFIASVKTHLESRGSLSPKQIEVLERIYADKTD